MKGNTNNSFDCFYNLDKSTNNDTKFFTQEFLNATYGKMLHTINQMPHEQFKKVDKEQHKFYVKLNNNSKHHDFFSFLQRGQMM